MATIKFYQYPKCSTCRKAQKFLEGTNIDYQSIDITVTPPNKKELKTAAERYLEGNYKKLFNTSGQVYRELGLKDKLASMSNNEMLSLLASNGKLIKRPLLVADDLSLVGFKESDWEDGLAD